MKSFVIGIEGLESSMLLAQKCIDTGKEFGVEVEHFPATNKYEAVELFNQNGFIKKIPQGIKEKHNPFVHEWLGMGEAGAFMSHYRLWQKCSEMNETIAIFEDDAEFIAPMPTDLKFKHYINIGGWLQVFEQPQRFKQFFDKDVRRFDINKPGIQKYPLGRVIGLYGYQITPFGARKLISFVNKTNRIWPVDIMINKQTIDLRTYHPQVVMTRPDASSSLRDLNVWKDFK